MKQKKNITTVEEYVEQVNFLENLAKKGEKSLTTDELKNMCEMATSVEAFEDANLMCVNP